MVHFTAHQFSALDANHAEQTIEPERVTIRNLLLELDDALPPRPFPHTEILGLDLHRHWSSEHRTALWFPHAFNNFRVEEIYLRYGKSRSQIRSLAALIEPVPGEPSDLGGFPAHGHLAVGLAADAFFYQFVIGPRAWLDFAQLQETLNGASADRLFAALMDLARHEYVLWWGEEIQLSTLTAVRDLRDVLADRSRARAGEHWLAIRKQVSPDTGMLAVSAQNVETELGRLFPVFDLAVRRS